MVFGFAHRGLRLGVRALVLNIFKGFCGGCCFHIHTLLLMQKYYFFAMYRIAYTKTYRSDDIHSA